MATCTVRVLLREPYDREETYKRLDTKMDLHDFRRFIVLAGKASKLPQGEYRYRGELTRDEILEQVRTFAVFAVGGAAKATEHMRTNGKQAYAVLVTEGEISQVGLESL